MDAAALWALLRFQWAAGARVAIRANAIVIGTVVFVIGMAPESRLGTSGMLLILRRFVLGAAAHEGRLETRYILAFVALILATSATSRVTLGLAGWMRSLPANARAIRHSAIGGLAMGQLSVLLFALLAAVATPLVYHRSLSVMRVASIPFLLIAAAAVVLPVERGATRLLAAAALLLFTLGRGWSLALGIAALVLYDVFAGGVRARVRVKRRRSIGGVGATFIATRLTWRAIGARPFVEALLVPAIPLAFAYLIPANNSLSAPSAGRVVRVAAGIALALHAAALANVVVSVRPVWAWARSLPWSAAQRVWSDVVAFSIPVLVSPVVALLLRPRAGIVVLALVPFVAATAALALRRAARRQTGAAGEVVIVAMGGAIVIGVWPLLVIAAVAATPLIVRVAAARERAIRATRWEELHHHAAGDPSWTTTR